jgi:hypothetical protein
MSKYKAIFDKSGLLAEFEDDQMTFLRADYEPQERSELARPMVIRDIEPYQNMINGQMISSRSEHRELLKRHNCIEIGNEKMETKIPKVDPMERRKILHQQLADVSDKECDSVLKQLRGN